MEKYGEILNDNSPREFEIESFDNDSKRNSVERKNSSNFKMNSGIFLNFYHHFLVYLT